MNYSSDLPIPVGRKCRTKQDLVLYVADYDKVTGSTKPLPVGSIFQPWDPKHWRGTEIPVTLGGNPDQFDWGVTSWDGHFMKWDDFFEKCELDE